MELVASESPNDRNPSTAPNTGTVYDQSVVTFRSSVDGFLFREVHGRAFSSQTDTYSLPADDTEHQRLDLQHKLLYLHIGGLYAHKEIVERSMQARGFAHPAVLDIGTGSGRWAIDMARLYPHAEVVGLDLVPPITNVEEIPPNCRFEVDDANLPLDHYNGAFNYVHVRCEAGGIRDFEDFLYRAAKLLRPGGVFQNVAAFIQVLKEDGTPYQCTSPEEPDFSYTEWVFDAVRRAETRRGNKAHQAAENCNIWLEANPNYTSVFSNTTYIPIGAWKEGLSARAHEVACMMKDDLCRVMLAMKPLLLLQMASESAQVEEAVSGAIQEMESLSINGFIRWKYMTAVRTDTDWVDSPVIT